MSHGHNVTRQVSTGSNQFVQALLNDGYRWDTSSETGNSNEIRVSFVGSGFDPGPANTIGIALGRWAAVSNIQLAEPESDTPNDPQLREGVELLFALAPSGTLGNFGGYSGTPYDALTENNVQNVNGDNILIADLGRTYTRIDDTATNNGRDAFDSNGNFTPAGFELVMHEIGHALGLKHPHDSGATNYQHYFPGVTPGDSSDLGDNALNQNLWTIMSYNDATIGYDCATPMAFDIAAIQTLYGARADASSGNDTYTIPTPGTATAWRCIWDTGGIDSIRYDGTYTNMIDLRPASLRDEYGGGGWVSYSNTGSTIGCGFTIAGDVTNAIPDQNGVTGVIIENAYGGSGYDGIIGNDVDNILDGGAGGDYMAGNKGNDTYFVDNTGDQVIEAAGGGTNDRVNTTLTSYTLGANLEFLDFQGPSSTGFTGTGNELNNTIQGYFGNDVLDGKAGADTMRGYSGDDTYYVDNVGDVVSDSSGNDRVNTTLTSYTLGAGIEVLDFQGPSSVAFKGTGNELNNTIQGYFGDDTLDGKSGADIMRGYSGNDTYFVDNAGDQVVEGAGAGTADRVFASVSYTLAAGVEIEAFATTGGTLNKAAISLTGNEFGQALIGNAAANTLTGGGGADKLYGYAGPDTLIGGTGADAFVFTALADSTGAPSGRDTVRDFNHAEGDRIDLHFIDANTALAGNQGFTFIGAGRYTHHAGELHAGFSGANTIVNGDVNGDGVDDFVITLTGRVTLEHGDFVL